MCAAAAAPALMQPRTRQPPVILLSLSVLTGGAAFQNKSPELGKLRSWHVKQQNQEPTFVEKCAVYEIPMDVYDTKN